MNIRYTILPDPQYGRELGKRFINLGHATDTEKEALRVKIFTVQGAIDEALKRRWTEGKDFQVGWDLDYSYYASGGIYSERIFCKEYVATVIEALETVPEREKWVYHTVCEILVNPKGKTIGECQERRGEFFIHDRAVFILSDKMKKEHRLRLGSSES
jgi:hypothetical protein